MMGRVNFRLMRSRTRSPLTSIKGTDRGNDYKVSSLPCTILPIADPTLFSLQARKLLKAYGPLNPHRHIYVASC